MNHAQFPRRAVLMAGGAGGVLLSSLGLGRVPEAGAAAPTSALGGVGLGLTTVLTSDYIVHDLAADGAEMLAGTFSPNGQSIVLFDVQAAYAILGWSRGALALYVGQPITPGSRLYDSGGLPLAGVQAFDVGSVSGESAWGSTTSRLLPVTLADPNATVTWQVLCGIVGSSEHIVTGDQPQQIAITPDSRYAFVANTGSGTVTPIELGRPGFSYDSTKHPQDIATPDIATGAGPGAVAANDAIAVVANFLDGTNRLSIIDIATLTVARHATNANLATTMSLAMEPNGTHCVAGTATGKICRVQLSNASTSSLQLGGSSDGMGGIAALADGSAAFVSDWTNGNVYRVNLPGLSLAATISVGDRPLTVQVSPDGMVWVLCQPTAGVGRLKRINPADNSVGPNYALPFALPNYFAIIPVAGQISSLVRTAWVVGPNGAYSQFYIGGPFAGQAMTQHTVPSSALGHLTSVAVNDHGEIWLTRSQHDAVFKWPGGRLACRPSFGGFLGEYLIVTV